MYGFIMACIELYNTGRNSLSLKSKDLATHTFKKNSRHTHPNPLNASPVSERSAYPLQNYVCFSLLTSRLESFGHTWTEAYYSKF